MTLSMLHRLKPSHLMLIRAIDDTGKLRLAAETVGISQPAASRILSEIETDTGGLLFDRQPRGMVPTPVGAAFIRRARVVLAEVEALANEVTQLRGGRAGVVRVGTVTGPAVGALVPALIDVRRSAPDIEPTIEVAPSVTLIRGLEEGRFDFVLARLGESNAAHTFHAYPGRTEEISLLARGEHPLVGRTVSLAETLAYEFVIQEPGSPIRTALENAFLENRLTTPTTTTNSSSLLVALSIITASDAITPQTHEVAHLLTRTGSDLGIIGIEERIVVPSFLALHNRHHRLSPVAQTLLDAILRRL